MGDAHNTYYDKDRSRPLNLHSFPLSLQGGNRPVETCTVINRQNPVGRNPERFSASSNDSP